MTKASSEDPLVHHVLLLGGFLILKGFTYNERCCSWCCSCSPDSKIRKQVLFDMFPDTPHQTLATIWRNCGEDFSTALDEALTVASLGNADEQGECSAVLCVSSHEACVDLI